MNLTLDYCRKCNSHCTTCGIWKMENPPELELQYIKKLISQISRLDYIYVSGGEPYISPIILDIARFVKENHPHCVWSGATNCISPRTTAVLNEIRNMGLNLFVEISLEGNEKEHDKIRGTKGNYQGVINVIEWCNNMGVPYGISTITETGEREALRLGVPYKRNLPRFGERYNTKGTGKKEYIRNCPALNGIVCTPDGDIYPCEEYSDMLYLGNIKTQHLADMRWEEVLDYVKAKKCQPCGMSCYFERQT